MDEISGIIGGSAGALGSLNQNSEVLGQEDFLLLLVTQLSNQDPLNPMDGQEFAAQLAQFSSLEQLIGIGDTLSTNGELNGLLAQSINSGVAAGLIGQQVEAQGSEIFILDGEASGIRIELGEAASNVTVEIKDEAGQVVRTLDLGTRGEGDFQLEWDGKDSEGNALPNGKFSVEVTATDDNGNNVSSRTFIQGQADRVTFGPEGILVWIGQTSIPLGNISSVGDTE